MNISKRDGAFEVPTLPTADSPTRRVSKEDGTVATLGRKLTKQDELELRESIAHAAGTRRTSSGHGGGSKTMLEG